MGTPPSQSFTPQTFGKYFLVDRIATGGMAEIFKAKTFSHGGFENLLVIKRILPHIGENQDFVGMFVDEARVSVALQHPNIVRVYDFGKILENYFIAMECVDGKDTRNLLRKLGRRKDGLAPLPEKFAAFIAHEVCKGLHYAHTKADINGNPFGIVHRDISPSNVLVSYEGEVKVADFGIAKAAGNVYQTRDGILKGKFEYMSPEQAQGKEMDHRSDLFSLGIILHEMLTGRRLFRTDSEISTLKKIRDAEVELPSVQRPGLDPRIERICLKALAKNPAERYANAQLMGDELREFMFPETSDTLRREFRDYLQQLFAEDMAEERQRLESGNAMALQLRDRLSTMDWDNSPSQVTMTRVTQTAVRFVVPWIAAIGLGMLVVFAAALGLLFLFIANQNTPMFGSLGAETPMDAPSGAVTGIDVAVIPSARILIDGELEGEGATLTVTGLSAGTHLLRLEADGHVPLEETLQVEEGKLVRVVKMLEPVAGVTPAPAPAPAPTAAPVPAKPAAVAGPPKVEFRSSPPGALVVVDGTEIGRTPFTWSDAGVGGTYAVEMRLEGHDTARGSLRDVKKGPQRYSLQLPAVSAPATLSVVLVDGGWANVYVDGKKLPKTAPIKDFQVSPGTHEVRIENPTIGLDLTETHAFVAGKPITVRAKSP